MSWGSSCELCMHSGGSHAIGCLNAPEIKQAPPREPEPECQICGAIISRGRLCGECAAIGDELMTPSGLPDPDDYHDAKRAEFYGDMKERQ